MTLGQTIIAASEGNVFKGSKGKFLFKQRLPAPQGTYVIAFQLRPCSAPHLDVVLQLNSAHVREHTHRARFAKFEDVIKAVAARSNVSWIKK